MCILHCVVLYLLYAFFSSSQTIIQKGPCRPYWKKVEACTKDNESKEKKKDDDDDNVSDDAGKKNDDKDDDPSSPSTRCFKYMMPWIDCASKYRNLYTLIEMDTNYTEGIEELEATFVGCPGRYPKSIGTSGSNL